MNLHKLLLAREAAGKPLGVGLIGAGKFGTMFLAQALRIPGVHIVGVADLRPDAANSNMQLAGWAAERLDAASLDNAAKSGRTCIGDDWRTLTAHPAIDIIIESTGDPVSAVTHILTAFKEGKSVVNVTVEADAYCGLGLANAAAEAGVVYSMAYGDQPALVCDLVDWARASGFPVVAAGRGHKWLPHYRQSTPDTIWDLWGLTREQIERGRLNPKMLNSFLDGSKPAIETSAIANACGLDAPEGGLMFPPGGADDLPNLMRPRSEGGGLERKGMVDVISSITLDGEPVPGEIRNGVWVVMEGESEYIRNCFDEYMLTTDDSGRYICSYKRWHLIGLELGISVANIGLRGEPTGVAAEFRADVGAFAKRDLKAGEMLDGEGGYTVTGGLRPADISVPGGYLPLGLAHNAPLIRDVAADQPVTWADVKLDETTDAYRLRRAIEPLHVKRDL